MALRSIFVHLIRNQFVGHFGLINNLATFVLFTFILLTLSSMVERAYVLNQRFEPAFAHAGACSPPGGIGDKPVGHFRNMYQSVFLDTHIHKTAEGRDVGNNTNKTIPSFRSSSFFTFGSNSNTLMVCADPCGFIQLFHDICQCRHPSIVALTYFCRFNFFFSSLLAISSETIYNSDP